VSSLLALFIVPQALPGKPLLALRDPGRPLPEGVQQDKHPANIAVVQDAVLDLAGP